MVKESTNTQYSYTISGNGVQNGNPSPSNILPFDGCGDKTENLYPLDINKLHVGRIENDGTIDYEVGTLVVGTDSVTYEASTAWRGFYTDFIQVNEDEKLTFSPNNSSTISWSCNCYDENDNFLGKATTQSTTSTRTFTLLTGTKKVRMNVTSSNTSYTITEPMLNVGSTALPYKPYGYTLPIEYGGSENLFDSTIYELVPASTTAQQKGINLGILPQGSYTLNAVTSSPTQIYRTTKNGDTYTYETILTLPYTFTTDGISEQIIRTAGQSGNSWADIGYTNIMLNRGSTSLPYEPYIEPINTDIYLGQVETTRNIKKLVLDGTEVWQFYEESRGTWQFYINNIGLNGVPISSALSNIAPYGATASTRHNYEYGCYTVTLGNGIAFQMGGAKDLFTDIASWKSYLATQYAAGTPVTVWYVLATPEVSITNEPLMKIGSYVDTINNTQSGIDITTNNLVVNTTIPPSKVDITSTATWVPINYNKYNTDTISTIAPIDFLSNGQDITVGLKGNVEQLEIPSPDNPVMPQGTGERTAQLYNTAETAWISGVLDDNGNSSSSTLSHYTSNFTEVNENTLYCLSGNIGDGNTVHRIYFYDDNKNWISRTPTMMCTEYAFTTPNNCKYIQVQVYNSVNDTSNWMLNTGSTALPYEPYGYKIPISSVNTTTPVYLGEVETTRRIKKLVLTGEENLKIWAMPSGSSTQRFYINMSGVGSYLSLCSHFIREEGNEDVTHFRFGGGTYSELIFFINNNISTVADFKSYLAAQYAAGTPVTVWYVLATEKTGIVNEPLMKLGEYADEVSNITVPTTKGSNTLSVNASVQPSNVQLSISGWVPHNNVKEYKNNAWMATSWEGFRDIVRAGNGPTRYPIGTKLYETWGDDTSNAWIIVDYDNSNYNDPDISALGYTHNVVLYEEKINYLKVFDNAEAWLYTESVLPAGTYRFTIPNYDATYGGNKTYIFTSTVDVPIHGQLTLSWVYNTNPTKVQGYSSSTSTTALFNADIAEWDGTTTSEDLGTIKLAMTDPDSTYGKLNHIHRARYGSNNYYQSGIRQWLNADATANNWWKPTNIFDRPYDNRNTDGGLYLMDKDFRKVIAAPNITCITNNIFETGTSGSTAFKLQTQYTIRDKIFLPTHTELNLSSNPNIGTVFSQYTNAGNDDRIKYRKDNGNAYYYWFRTPYSSYAYFVRSVGSSGALNNSGAYYPGGAVRACIIQ